MIAGGSNITMIDGNEIRVDNVKVGDDVLAYDFENKRTMFSKVTGIRVSNGTGVEIVTTTTKLAATPEQVIFTSDRADSKKSSDLMVGDDILRFDFFEGRKEKILENNTFQPSVFFGISVSEFGNLIANGLIVKSD